MKVALVHDYLREYGGAERVVETLHEMWPEAPLFTSFVDWEALGQHRERFKKWDIRTARVELIPGIRRIPGIGLFTDWLIRKFHSPLRFLAPNIWASLDVSGYDVVISSSGWFMCRGVANNQQLTSNHEPITNNKQLHICYIHHPPRNLYGYATGSDLQRYWPVRVYAAIINFFLRHYDFDTAQRVDYFIANSEETKRRVAKFYRRDATVIYPPVETGVSRPAFTKAVSFAKVTPQTGSAGKQASGVMARRKDYFLSVGRLTYSKRVDLAIGAVNKLNLPLKIVGAGKEEPYLRSIAGPTVEFLGPVTDAELSSLYRGAKALIFCALDEDFGIVPVESMAHGTPVIALAQGGVLETVVDGTSRKDSKWATGILFPKSTVESVCAALETFLKRFADVDLHNNCVKQAKKFFKERFKRELRLFVSKHVSIL